MWAPAFTQSLADRRVLLLGYGGVGKAVAARLAPFEVTVTAVASRAREEDGMPVHGVDELPALLPLAEIVILTLPGGDATRHIVDDGFLAALPDGALVVNVGRGPLIDTDALVDHVRRGRIRAALDVTDPEPLPAGHPLWGLPGRPHRAPRRRRVERDAPADRAARAHPDRADAGGRTPGQRGDPGLTLAHSRTSRPSRAQLRA